MKLVMKNRFLLLLTVVVISIIVFFYYSIVSEKSFYNQQLENDVKIIAPISNTVDMVPIKKDSNFIQLEQVEFIENNGIIKFDFNICQLNDLYYYIDTLNSKFKFDKTILDNVDMYYPELNILNIPVYNIVGNYYLIRLPSKRMIYIPQSTCLKYESWNKFILNSYGISRKSGVEIYDKKNGKKLTFPLQKEAELLCPLKVDNDWLYVKYDCYYNSEDNSKYEGQKCVKYIDSCDSQSGWLKWRTNDSLLVKFYLIQ
jgi:hypothetical protein